MNLKKCTCGIQLTTRNVVEVKRGDMLGIDCLLVTCKGCKSSAMITKRKKAIGR